MFFLVIILKAELPLLTAKEPTSLPLSDNQCRHLNNIDLLITEKEEIITSKPTFEQLSIDEKKEKFKMVEKFDIIGNILGPFGKWQLRTVLLIFLCKIPSSWFMACIIFTAPAPRHGEFYCKPPTDLPIHNKTVWTKISHPEKIEKEDKEFKIDFCNVYDDALEHAHQFYKSNDTSKPWELPQRNSNIVPCESFEHHAQYTSLITDFDLVCSRDILVAVTQFFHLFGVLLGGCIAVKLLEYISPRRVMLIGMITQIACGNITGLVNSYELHVFFRCMSAVCCAQMYTAGHMICKKNRFNFIYSQSRLA